MLASPPLSTSLWGRLIDRRHDLRHQSDAASLQKLRELDEALVEYVEAPLPGDWIISCLMECDALPALQRLIELRGSVVLRRVTGEQVTKILKGGSYKFLALHREHGRLTSHMTTAALRASLTNDDLEMYRFVQDTLGNTRTFTESIRPERLLMSTGPNLAGVIAEELRSLASGKAIKFRDFFYWMLVSIHPFARLKAFSVIACSGTFIDMSLDDRRQRQALDDLPEHAKFLITGNASSHGKLRIQAMEPSFEAVLSRSIEGHFFGIDAKELAAHLSSAEIARTHA